MRLPTRLALAALTLLAGLAHADDKRTLFFGHDDRRAVAPTVAPWNALGQVESADGTVCTGTLVGPKAVLTAGHCFVAKGGRLLPGRQFQLGLSGARAARTVALSRVWVDARLAKGLEWKDGGWIVPPRVARYDVALVELAEPVSGVAPLPVFAGDAAALRATLAEARQRVSQGGYPEDALDTLMVHSDCRVTALTRTGLIAHRCDTLPGDSGSPLLVKVGGGWQLVGVQSSAPAAPDRARADNMALAAPTFVPQLARWQARAATPR